LLLPKDGLGSLPPGSPGGRIIPLGPPEILESLNDAESAPPVIENETVSPASASVAANVVTEVVEFSTKSTARVAPSAKTGDESSSIIVMVAVPSPIAALTGSLRVIVKVSSSSSKLSGTKVSRPIVTEVEPAGIVAVPLK